jgi:ATP/maltotriose-dependent transcriptional regulator MalT
LTTFTARQVQVVRLIAAGYSNEEAGRELGITGRTAKAHADELRRKLRVSKRREIPRAYWRETGDNPYPEAA